MRLPFLPTLFFICCLFGCSEVSEVKTLRLAHGLDITHPVHQGMVRLSELVEEKSNGKLEVRIYPSGQLGSERECLELLQIGSLDITKVSAAVMENFVPTYEVLGLPYIFKSREHSYEVLDGPIGDELLEQGSKYRLRGLCFYDAGSRSFYTKKPIKNPEDLTGLKIRVQRSKTAVEMVNHMGAAPTPIPWGELYTALQQGVVDGAENNPPSFYFSRHYEVCKYYSINEHTTVPDVLLIGTNTWKRLSEQERKWISEAAKESARFQRVVWNKSEKECLEKMIEEGVEVSYPDKAPFSTKIEAMFDKYSGREDFVELIERIRNSDRKPSLSLKL